MPIVATYCHRIVASDFEYPSKRAKNARRMLYVGRTELQVKQIYGTSRLAAVNALRRAIRRSAELLRPDQDLQDWRWVDTEGDYPRGSPYDTC
jgi:hypothetical protein